MPAAGLSTLSAHRRPLATAAAAAGALIALWFVPTAHATPDEPEHPSRDGVSTADETSDASDTKADNSGATPQGAQLAETGGFDSTPLVAGGLGSLGVGGTLIVLAQRRSRGGTA